MSSLLTLMFILAWFGLHWQAVAVAALICGAAGCVLDRWSRRTRRPPAARPVAASVPTVFNPWA